MRNITDIKGEEALDVLADIIDPAIKIMTDAKIRELAEGGDKIGVIKRILKNHKESIIEILAILDGIPVKEYKKTLNVLTLPYKVIALFSDQELMSFFTYAESMEVAVSSIESAVNTEAPKK